MHFQFYFFLLWVQIEGEPEDKEQQKRTYSEDEKVQEAEQSGRPAASGKQCSRAGRVKRTARWAIRRELSEQIWSRRANVESKACQLTRKAGPTNNSRHQRAEIVNCARVGAIDLKSGAKTKTTTGCSKTRALTKRVPFRI